MAYNEYYVVLKLNDYACRLHASDLLITIITMAATYTYSRNVTIIYFLSFLALYIFLLFFSLSGDISLYCSVTCKFFLNCTL